MGKQHPHAPVGRADILSVLDDYHSTIRDLLLLGMSINTPTACYRPGIEGTFTGLGDSFDPTRHQLAINIRAGALLKSAVRTSAEMVKELADPVCPVLVQCEDLASGTANQVVTPGEAIFLTGKRLRFDKADLEQGAFFTAADAALPPFTQLGDDSSPRNEIYYAQPVLVGIRDGGKTMRNAAFLLLLRLRVVSPAMGVYHRETGAGPGRTVHLKGR